MWKEWRQKEIFQAPAVQPTQYELEVREDTLDVEEGSEKDGSGRIAQVFSGSHRQWQKKGLRQRCEVWLHLETTVLIILFQLLAYLHACLQVLVIIKSGALVKRRWIASVYIALRPLFSTYKQLIVQFFYILLSKQFRGKVT